METTSVNKKLSLFDSTMIIMGSMIGSGVFIVSSDIIAEVHSPGLLLVVWILSGIITVMGALNYGELAAMYPKAGGQYVYLREAFNPLLGFIYGWTLFTVIQTGTIAAVGVAFAKYTAVLFPNISDKPFFEIYGFGINPQQILAIFCIMLLTSLNFKGLRLGSLLQNVFTVTKIGALAAVIIVGIIVGVNGSGNISHFKPVLPSDFSILYIPIIFSAMVGSLFSSDAWNNITFTAGEILNPKRNLPLSLAIGTSVVVFLYLLTNVTYIYILGPAGIQNAENSRVGAELMQAIYGDAGKLLMAGLIMVSTFGCLNGLILSGPRVYYAMAKDSLFFKPAGVLNKHNVPQNSLFYQAIWASILTLSGSYSKLLDYVIFSVLIFYILTVIGLIRLRKTNPDTNRPYKVPLYPFFPICYIALAFITCICLIIYKPEYSIGGLAIVLIGIPIYYLFINKNKSE